MEIRGERQCLECGKTWSYFETREIECPECGSIKSKSISEAEFDTQGSSKEDSIDFQEIFSDLSSDETFVDAVKEVEDRSREYISKYGFVKGGELRPPEPSYVMASEAMEIADVFRRHPDEITPDQRHYFIDLVKGIDPGTPPEPDERPPSLDTFHNLAVARLVDEYATEVSQYARRNDFDVPSEVEEARELAKRTKATEGKEDDATKGLRLLRDAYEKLSPTV